MKIKKQTHQAEKLQKPRGKQKGNTAHQKQKGQKRTKNNKKKGKENRKKAKET